MIYLYAITGPMRGELEGVGLDGAPLQVLPIGSLSAVYSVHEDGCDIRADGDTCWAHERAVEAVMWSQDAALPARLGTTFSDLDELSTAVGRDAAALEQRLAQVSGCVELAVRIDPLIPRDGQAATGRQYLLEKLSVQRHIQALAESGLSALDDVALAWKVAEASATRSLSISYLVPMGDVERFSGAVERLQEDRPELHLSCTGPWAPYSFSDPRAGEAA